MVISTNMSMFRNGTSSFAFFVEYGVADLSILLLKRNNISKSGWVLDVLNETDIQKLLNLLFDMHLEFCLKFFEAYFTSLASSLTLSFMNDQLLIKFMHLSVCLPKTSLDSCKRLRSVCLSLLGKLALIKTGVLLLLWLQG